MSWPAPRCRAGRTGKNAQPIPHVEISRPSVYIIVDTFYPTSTAHAMPDFERVELASIAALRVGRRQARRRPSGNIVSTSAMLSRSSMRHSCGPYRRDAKARRAGSPSVSSTEWRSPSSIPSGTMPTGSSLQEGPGTMSEERITRVSLEEAPPSEGRQDGLGPPPPRAGRGSGAGHRSRRKRSLRQDHRLVEGQAGRSAANRRSCRFAWTTTCWLSSRLRGADTRPE